MKVRTSFNNAAQHYNNYGVLQQEIAQRLFFNLQLIKKEPECVVDLGAGTGFLTHLLCQHFKNTQILALDFAECSLKLNTPQTANKSNPQKNAQLLPICARAEELPLDDDCADIVVSNLMMQWCPDIETVIKECLRVLKDDGLLMFSTFGVDTLSELKTSWAAVDDYAHVNNFVDMHTLGDVLLKYGLTEPVMEMEMLTLTYETVVDLMRDIKGIGANTVVTNRPKHLVGKTKFEQMTKRYEKFRTDGKLPVSYEVIYGHAFKKSPLVDDSNIAIKQLV